MLEALGRRRGTAAGRVAGTALRPGLRGRLHPALALALLLGLATLAIAIGLVALALSLSGSLRSAAVQPLPDARLGTERLQLEKPERRILSAAWDGPGQQLHLLQADGSAQHWQGSPQLWSADRLPDGMDIASSVLIAGCGDDPMLVPQLDCPLPHALWAVDGRGAAARWDGGWQWLSGIGRLNVGSRGATLEDVTVAALSEDGRFAMLAGPAGTAGLYDTDLHGWRQLHLPDPLPGAGDRPPAALQLAAHLVYWQGRFWWGSADGLLAIDPQSGEASRIAPGPVTALAAASVGRSLYAAVSIYCEEPDPAAKNGPPPQLCPAVVRIASDGALQSLWKQQPTRETIQQSDLIDVVALGQRLLLVARQGLLEMQGGNTVQLLDQPIQLAQRLSEDREAIVSGNRLKIYTPGGEDATDWTLPGDTGRPVQLLEMPDKSMLLLTSSGALLALLTDGQVIAASPPRASGFDPASARRSVVNGDSVALIGDSDILLHDVGSRSYELLRPQAMPGWLFDDSTALVLAPQRDRLFALRPGNPHLIVLDLASGDVEAESVAALETLASPTLPRASEDGFTVSDAHGTVVTLDLSVMWPVPAPRPIVPTGRAAPAWPANCPYCLTVAQGPSRQPAKAPSVQVLAPPATEGNGGPSTWLQVFDNAGRMAAMLPGGDIVDIEPYGDAQPVPRRVLSPDSVRSMTGLGAQSLIVDNGNILRYGDSLEPLSGQGLPIRIDALDRAEVLPGPKLDDRPVLAMQSGDIATVYDLGNRQQRSVRMEGLRLLGAVDALPVFVVGNRLYKGQQAVWSGEAGWQMTRGFANQAVGTLALMQRGEARLLVQVGSQATAGACLFDSRLPVPLAEIEGLAQDGRSIFARTPRGIFVYRAARHSWTGPSSGSPTCGPQTGYADAAAAGLTDPDWYRVSRFSPDLDDLWPGAESLRRDDYRLQAVEGGSAFPGDRVLDIAPDAKGMAFGILTPHTQWSLTRDGDVYPVLAYETTAGFDKAQLPDWTQPETLTARIAATERQSIPDSRAETERRKLANCPLCEPRAALPDARALDVPATPVRVVLTDNKPQLRVTDGRHRLPLTQAADGRLGWDVVTAVLARPEALYLGTAAGVFRMAPPAIDTSGSTPRLPVTGGLQFIDDAQLGDPQSAATRVFTGWNGRTVYADNGDRCRAIVEEDPKRDPAADAPACPPGAASTAQVSAGNAFWQWRHDSGGTSAEYLQPGGAPSGVAVTWRNGRFRHNQVLDAMTCRGMTVATFPGGLLILKADGAAGVLPLARAEGSRLICGNRSLMGPDRPPYLGYLQGPDGTLQALAPGGATGTYRLVALAAGSEEAQLLLSGERPDIVLERRSLRLSLLPSGSGLRYGLRYELRRSDGKWVAQDWLSGRLRIDEIQALALVDDTAWAVTPDGLTPLAQVSALNRIALSRRGNVLVPFLPDDAQCDTAFAQVQAGRVQLFCQGETRDIWSGSLADAVAGKPATRQPLQGGLMTTALLPPAPPPPAATAPQVAPDDRPPPPAWRGWSAESRRRADGSLAGILLHWQGRDIQLRDGRLSSDIVTGLAALDAERLELIAGGHWWHLPLKAPAKSTPQQERTPADLAAVDLVGSLSDLRRQGTDALCLRSNGQWLAVAADLSQRLPQGDCTQVLGQDRLWHWQSDDRDRLTVSRLDAGGGRQQRRMEQGRFTDDIVTGPPLPVVGWPGLGSAVLLPTQGGLRVLDTGLRDADLRNEGSGPAPALAVQLEPGSAALLQDGQILPVQGSPTLPGLGPLLPAGGRALALRAERDGWTGLLYSAEGRLGRSSLFTGTERPLAYPAQVPVAASALPAGTPPSMLTAQDGRLALRSNAGLRRIDAPAAILLAAPWQGLILAVGADRIDLIDAKQ